MDLRFLFPVNLYKLSKFTNWANSQKPQKGTHNQVTDDSSFKDSILAYFYHKWLTRHKELFQPKGKSTSHEHISTGWSVYDFTGRFHGIKNKDTAEQLLYYLSQKWKVIQILFKLQIYLNIMVYSCHNGWTNNESHWSQTTLNKS